MIADSEKSRTIEVQRVINNQNIKFFLDWQGDIFYDINNERERKKKDCLDEKGACLFFFLCLS